MQTLTHNPLFIPLAVAIAVIAIFPWLAGYIVLIERKVLADFQVSAAGGAAQRRAKDHQGATGAAHLVCL